jgi:hypothetical protein
MKKRGRTAGRSALRWLLPNFSLRWTFLCAALLFGIPVSLSLGLAASTAQAQSSDPEAKAAVEFMRTVMDQVNPSLSVEDGYCASALPWAIYSHATESDLDWRQVFALAWQESRFDCHAKNSKDRGGAFGPFQIRRVWESIVGDPRYRYFDPELAADRVVRILRYYQETDRHTELFKRGFRFPLLCLFNAGESRELNMEYCKSVGRKMDVVKKGWSDFREGKLVAVSAN